MPFRKEMPTDIKAPDARRGRRMNSRVPVTLEWQGPDGARHHEEGCTCVLNHYGCLLVAPRDLPLNQRIRLTNLANGRSLDAVVVWKGKERVEGWELGVELVDPDLEFWGLDL